MSTTVQVVNDGTTFKDNELWQETLAKITTGFTLATWDKSDRVSNILTAGANQETSTESWTGTGGFGSAIKQKLVSSSFTPAEIGNIIVAIKLGKAISTVYVSPKLVTSSKQFVSYCGTIQNESSVSVDPGESNVRDGTSYTIDDTEYTGNMTLPTEAQVETGVQFGAGGTEYTGTLEAGSEPVDDISNYQYID
jgi:hypothetical protein